MTQYHGIDPNGVGGAVSPNGNRYGVFGESNNTNAPGANFGVGVAGVSAAGDGVWGLSRSDFGVYGRSDADPSSVSTPWGVVGDGAVGVVGYTSGRGSDIGVWGEGDGGIGVQGDSSTGKAGLFTNTDAQNSNAALEVNSAGTGPAVYANSGAGPSVYAYSASGRNAVFGTCTNGNGVYGYAQSSGTGTVGHSINGIGIYGRTDNSHQYAGYFQGNVYVAGTLNKSALAFVIDHPLDPANKYLSHSGVESSDMKNLYDGVVVLDAAGEATVELPAWFEALNTDFRYQLTCIGDFAPVYIAEKVRDHRFRIAGGKQALEVSWQLTGTRHDAYARAHRVQVEQEKDNKGRGRYLHPELYGEAPENHINGVQHAELNEQVKRMEEWTIGQQATATLDRTDKLRAQLEEALEKRRKLRAQPQE